MGGPEGLKHLQVADPQDWSPGRTPTHTSPQQRHQPHPPSPARCEHKVTCRGWFTCRAKMMWAASTMRQVPTSAGRGVVQVEDEIKGPA